ncbi:MAG: hypothetical protein ACXWTY_00700 [Methylobacter sp.]|jgi:hypothetical protein
MINVNTEFDIERIDNGLLVTSGIGDEQTRRYYENINQVISALTTELEEQFKQSRHFTWDGNFKIILTAHDIGRESHHD